MEAKADTSNKKVRAFLKLLKELLNEIFCYCENIEEVNTVLQKFKCDYDNFDLELLKSKASEDEIKKIRDDIYKNLKYASYHNFMYCSIFGFKGSSIVESYNSIIKASSVKLHGNMTLHTSTNQLLGIQEQRESKRKT